MPPEILRACEGPVKGKETVLETRLRAGCLASGPLAY